MVPFIVRAALSLIAPKAPRWVADLIATVVPEIVELARTAIEDKRLDFIATVESIKGGLEEALVHVPEWADEPAEDREAMLAGMALFAVFLYRTAGSKPRKRGRDIAKRIRQVRRSR